jgi:hypothetical protein
MSSPSNCTVPSTRAPGATSCMRFSDRSTVDLPQPDGPMNAVTLRGGTESETCCTAWNLP